MLLPSIWWPILQPATRGRSTCLGFTFAELPSLITVCRLNCDSFVISLFLLKVVCFVELFSPRLRTTTCTPSSHCRRLRPGSMEVRDACLFLVAEIFMVWVYMLVLFHYLSGRMHSFLWFSNPGWLNPPHICIIILHPLLSFAVFVGPKVELG